MKKNVNWSELVEDISENLILTQAQFAEKCQTTQQSVSNWKTGIRRPGVYARGKIRNLAKDAGLKLEDYQAELCIDTEVKKSVDKVLNHYKGDKDFVISKFKEYLQSQEG